jgi:hypothetical protein
MTHSGARVTHSGARVRHARARPRHAPPPPRHAQAPPRHAPPPLRHARVPPHHAPPTTRHAPSWGRVGAHPRSWHRAVRRIWRRALDAARGLKRQMRRTLRLRINTPWGTVSLIIHHISRDTRRGGNWGWEMDHWGWEEAVEGVHRGGKRRIAGPQTADPQGKPVGRVGPVCNVVDAIGVGGSWRVVDQRDLAPWLKRHDRGWLVRPRPCLIPPRSISGQHCPQPRAGGPGLRPHGAPLPTPSRTSTDVMDGKRIIAHPTVLAP